MRRSLAVAVMLGGGWCGAQQPVAPVPMVSPQAAYDDSTRPVDIVRKSIANWSDVEVTALGVAMKKASAACAERTPAMYTGDDLVALSKLCSFGQEWGPSKNAAAKYIAATDGAAKTQLSLAYGLQLDGSLHMHDLHEIMTDAKAMLAGVPYDAIVNAACDGAISYLQLAYTSEALELEGLRQPLLLAAIAAEKVEVPRRDLYASGLSQAALLQYANRPEDAAASVAALDAALVAGVGDEAKLSPDDAVPIGAARRQYGLLGKPLPQVTLTMSLANLEETPELETKFGAGTALLLFPDWCAQCVRLKNFWKAERTDQGLVKLVVLLAQAAPDKAALRVAEKEQFVAAAAARAARAAAESSPVPVAPPVAVAPEKPKTAAELLLNTQTLVVPPETLALFAAGDFPFVVMVDHAGIVRFAGSGPENLLRPGDFLDRVVEHVAETWPPVGKKLNTDERR